MCDATHHNSFGLLLTSVNEVFKCIVYIFQNIYFPVLIFMLYSTSGVIWQAKEINYKKEINRDMEDLVINSLEISVKIRKWK